MLQKPKTQATKTQKTAKNTYTENDECETERYRMCRLGYGIQEELY